MHAKALYPFAPEAHGAASRRPPQPIARKKRRRFPLQVELHAELAAREGFGQMMHRLCRRNVSLLRVVGSRHRFKNFFMLLCSSNMLTETMSIDMLCNIYSELPCPDHSSTNILPPVCNLTARISHNRSLYLQSHQKKRTQIYVPFSMPRSRQLGWVKRMILIGHYFSRYVSYFPQCSHSILLAFSYVTFHLWP